MSFDIAVLGLKSVLALERIIREFIDEKEPCWNILVICRTEV